MKSEVVVVTGASAGIDRATEECAPLAMIAEQAGAGATTGKMRVMDIRPESVHQRIPFAIGSPQEINIYEQAYREG